MAYQFLVTSASIVVGQSQSNAIVLNEATAVSLTTGSNITGTSVTFLVSTNGTDFFPLYDDTSTEVSLTVTTAARNYTLPVATFFPYNFLKLRLGNSASAVNQATVNTLFTVNAKIL